VNGNHKGGLDLSLSLSHTLFLLSRRREHLHARALQIRAELSTHILRETGPQRPTHSFWSCLFESVCLSVGVCEGGGVPRERVSRAAAEGRRAECVCEAE